MTTKRAALIALAAVLLGVGWFFGFRCREEVTLYQTVCYSWFLPRWVVLSDSSGHRYAWIRVHGLRTSLDASAVYVAFRDNPINDFISVTDSPYGRVFAHELARGDDGKIDLEISFHGKALTKAEVIDRIACRSWEHDPISLPGNRAERYRCLDPSARRRLSASEARDIVAALTIPSGRDFIKSAMKYSKGERLFAGRHYEM